MSFRLLPKDPKFFDLFVADGDNLAAAARPSTRWSTVRPPRDAGRDDPGAREARRRDRPRGQPRLEDAFVTPFDREDIHELVSRLDDVVDGIQSVAETFVIYGVPRRPPRPSGWLRSSTHRPASLPRHSASWMGSRTWRPISRTIHSLEKQADGLSRAAIARLFHDDLPPIEVIKWRDLYADLENTVDAAEDAAEAMERMYHKAN